HHSHRFTTSIQGFSGMACSGPPECRALRSRSTKGFASMEATDLPVNDYVTGANAIVGGGPTPQPCTVSFKVVWSGVDERLTIRNDDPVFGGFAGEFVRNTAQLEWRGAGGGARGGVCFAALA